MDNLQFFPYPSFKESQKIAYEKLRDALLAQKHFLLHLPTGGGKTSAVLALAIQKAIEKDLRIIYLTSRHEQHRKPVEEFLKICKKTNLKLYLTSFKSKKIMCPFLKEIETRDFYEMCKLAKKNRTCNYFLNLSNKNVSVIQKIKNEILNPKQLKQKYKFDLAQLIFDFSIKKKLCPYEIAGLIGEESILVIGDFYHIFGHHLAEFLKRLGYTLEKVILIIDEGDQLPERIRGHYSEHLTTFMINSALAQARKFLEALSEKQVTFWEEYIDLLHSFQNIFIHFCKENLQWKYEEEIEKQKFLDEISKRFDVSELVNVFYQA